MVAIYLDQFSIVLPVNPVKRVERLTPQSRRQEREKQYPASFAEILQKEMQGENNYDSHSFDATA